MLTYVIIWLVCAMVMFSVELIRDPRILSSTQASAPDRYLLAFIALTAWPAIVVYCVIFAPIVWFLRKFVKR